MAAHISPEDIDLIAIALTNARARSEALPTYPGAIPICMTDAYAIQDAAIQLWPDRLAGWKLGRIPAPVQADHGGRKKLAGPVFAQSILPHPAQFTSIRGGLCAIEGELIIQLCADIPVGAMPSREGVRASIAKACAGIEMASSPYAGMNDRGPAATASDFGVNGALILGPEMDLAVALAGGFNCEVSIDGNAQAQKDFVSSLGDPVSIILELIEILFERGRGLKAGDLISTGAITGVHPIVAGQAGKARFATPHGACDVDVSVA